MREPMSADYGVLESVRGRFEQVRAVLGDVAQPVRSSCDDALTGAGEFGPDLERGAVAFLLAWRETLALCGESAGLIAANVGTFAVDVRVVDAADVVQVRI
jgi:hypothetical protein